MELHLELTSTRWFLRFRFLLAQYRWDSERFDKNSLEELHYINQLMLERFEGNRNHRKKFLLLLKLQDFIRRIGLQQSAETRKVVMWNYPRECIHVLPDAHTYFGLRGNEFQKTSYLKWRTSRARKNRPQRFIGVGYKDKGTWSNKAIDGSPSWKVVVTSESARNGTNYYQMDYWEEAPQIWPDSVGKLSHNSENRRVTRKHR